MRGTLGECYPIGVVSFKVPIPIHARVLVLRISLVLAVAVLHATATAHLPLLQSAPAHLHGNVTTGHNEPEFPASTYLLFLQSHLSSSPSSRSLTQWNSIEAQFVQELVKCLESDPRCPYYLGNLYFQGLVPRGLVSATDPGKNVTRALALWHYAASLGNTDAQYQLGLVYSTYYNPPSFLTPPQDVWNQLQKKESKKKCMAKRPCDSAEDKIEAVVGELLSPVEAYRLITTMRVLDLGPDALNVQKHEAVLSNNFLKYINKRQEINRTINVRENPNDPSQCPLHTELVNDIPFANSSCLLSLDNTAVNQEDRFPLYRRDCLAILYYYLAAQGGHIGAQIALGYRHFSRLGVPDRCHAAAAYYLRVAREVVELSSEGIPQAASNVRVSILGLSTGHGSDKTRMAAASGEFKSHYLDLQFHVAETGDPRIQTAVGKLHLFGLEDLPQDFDKAFHYFDLAAQSDYKDAIAYLGYLYTLGLGAPKNLDVAYRLFMYAATAPQDVLAHNGLGYIYFKGTEKVPVNLGKALAHFNISASRGFPDAQYNLGAMYLSGAGVTQSFTKGFSWLTRAVEQGHSGATYMMGVVHLNGIGTLRDCRLAAALFKRVAAKHGWVAERLQKASILLGKHRKDEAAFIYWSLAEAGHEVAQSNLGLLLDGGGVRPLARDHTDLTGPLDMIRRLMSYIPVVKRRFFRPTSLFSLDHFSSVGVNRAFAQRYWELTANQNSPQGHCRLGDYAYYGWGVVPAGQESLDLSHFRMITGIDQSDVELPSSIFADSEGESMSEWGLPRRLFSSSYVRRLQPEYRLAFELYEKAVASAPSSSFWGNTYLAQAEFSLARLHQLGAGVPQDLQIARRRFIRMAELDASVSTIPATISVLMLHVHSALLYIRRKSVWGVLAEDRRLFMILVNAMVVSVILLLRPILKRDTIR